MADLKPWLKIKARFEAGEAVPVGVRAMAESVLGERFIRRGSGGRRPDFRDREAGDDSFDDDRNGVVAL